MARQLMSNQELITQAGISNSVYYKRVKHNKDVSPVIAGKISYALHTDISNIITTGEAEHKINDSI